MSQLPRVILKAKRARPFFGMHPWVYAGAIEAVEGTPADGTVVDLVSTAGTFVARGLYNSQSKIRVRLYSWDPAPALDDAFFRTQLQRAIHLRRDVLRLTGSCRIVFSEADGLSGMTIDEFDGWRAEPRKGPVDGDVTRPLTGLGSPERWLVVQFTSLAMAQRREMFADLLTELVQPAGIYLRTERGIGQLEGLELHDGPLGGNVPTEPIIIEENGLRLYVHLSEGQKTGYYLDQRDNRQVVARLAVGRRMLDAFCYSGGFGLHAARAGADSVLGIDASEPALELARANATLNSLTNIRFEKGDVFGQLDRLVAANERFGVVVLDPPKFARSKAAIDEALRGYRRLIVQSLKSLEPDGILAMCCCSGLIERQMLHDLLAQEASQARRPLQILESRGAAPDHPVSAMCPETNYLKCVVCRVV
ncbi:MAG: class I SAM-dependent rRNA methyltransferase [Planctomycetes bacterium]|nr:class I SAM-dependent rRNA methyltransferase [Planctomycetota bacterium]